MILVLFRGVLIEINAKGAVTHLRLNRFNNQFEEEKITTHRRLFLCRVFLYCIEIMLSARERNELILNVSKT